MTKAHRRTVLRGHRTPGAGFRDFRLNLTCDIGCLNPLCQTQLRCLVGSFPRSLVSMGTGIRENDPKMSVARYDRRRPLSQCRGPGEEPKNAS